MASNKDRKKSDTDNTHPSGSSTSQKNSVSSEFDNRDVKKDKWKQKKKINYYLSKEDIKHLVQNTRFSEQELR